MPDPTLLDERIKRDFQYYPLTPEKQALHEAMRNSVRGVAFQMVRLAPQCREQSLAITHLEEALFWINAAIARNPLVKEEGE